MMHGYVPVLPQCWPASFSVTRRHHHAISRPSGAAAGMSHSREKQPHPVSVDLQTQPHHGLRCLSCLGVTSLGSRSMLRVMYRAAMSGGMSPLSPYVHVGYVCTGPVAAPASHPAFSSLRNFWPSGRLPLRRSRFIILTRYTKHGWERDSPSPRLLGGPASGTGKQFPAVRQVSTYVLLTYTPTRHNALLRHPAPTLVLADPLRSSGQWPVETCIQAPHPHGHDLALTRSRCRRLFSVNMAASP